MSRPAFDFSHLSPAERIQLAEDLWDSLPSEALPLSPAHLEELERRRRAVADDPLAGQDWRAALDDLERGA